MALEPVGVIAIVQGFGPFMTKMGSMNRAMLGVGKSALVASKGLTAGGIALGAIGLAAVGAAVAVAGVAIAIGKIGVASLDTVISVESAFAGVLKTTNDLGTSLFNLSQKGEGVFQSFRGLTKEVPLAFEDLAEIGQLGGQLGVASGDIADFTETIASIAVSTDLTSEEAALGLARLSSIFGYSTDEIADNVQKQASSLVFLGNNYAATEQEILLASRNIANAGAIAGFTQADVFGIGTSFKVSGVMAEAGGTAVRNAILTMNSAVAAGAGTIDEEWQGVLKTIVTETGVGFSDLVDIFETGGDGLDNFAKQSGYSIDTISKALSEGLGVGGTKELTKFAEVAGLASGQFIEMWGENPAEAFSMFVDGLAASGDDATAILDELGLGSSRSLNTFLGLANNSELLTQAITDSNRAFEQNIALTREAGIRFGTLESQIQIAKNQLRDIGLEIGLSLAPALTGILQNIDWDGFANKIKTVAIPAIENLVSKFTDFFGLSADKGPQLGDFKPLGPKALSPFQEFTNSILLPIKELQADIQEPIENVKAAFRRLVGSVQKDMPLLTSIFKQNNDYVRDTYGVDVPTALEDVATSVSGLALIWGDLVLVLGIFMRLGQSLAAVVPANIKLMVDMTRIELKMFEGIFESIQDGIDGGWGEFWSGLGTTVDTAAADIVSAVEAMLTSILSSLGVNVPLIFEKGRAVGSALWTGFQAGLGGGSTTQTGPAPGSQVHFGAEDQVKSGFRNVVDVAKRVLKSDSPSKVFMGIGEDVSKGLAIGIQSSMGMADRAVRSMIDPMIAAPQTVMPTSGRGSTEVTNNRGITIDANYYKTQSPNTIADDLALVSALG